jgi:hypothetical protein
MGVVRARGGGEGTNGNEGGDEEGSVHDPEKDELTTTFTTITKLQSWPSWSSWFHRQTTC